MGDYLNNADADALDSFARTAIHRLTQKYNIPSDCQDLKFLMSIHEHFVRLSKEPEPADAQRRAHILAERHNREARERGLRV